MARGKKKPVIIGAAVLGVLASGLFVARLQQAPARAATASAPTGTIIISAQLGETFAPAPSSAAPALTAQQAWQQYAPQVGSSLTTIPSNVTAELGLFTLPAGPADLPGTSSLAISNGEAYTALNELAWGYSWHSCPQYAGSLGPDQATPPPNPCIAWLFLDANTGQQIVQTWQV